MLRVKDPAVSIPFYKEHFGTSLVHRIDFPQWYHIDSTHCQTIQENSVSGGKEYKREMRN